MAAMVLQDDDGTIVSLEDVEAGRVQLDPLENGDWKLIVGDDEFTIIAKRKNVIEVTYYGKAATAA